MSPSQEDDNDDKMQLASIAMSSSSRSTTTSQAQGVLQPSHPPVHHHHHPKEAQSPAQASKLASSAAPPQPPPPTRPDGTSYTYQVYVLQDALPNKHPAPTEGCCAAVLAVRPFGPRSPLLSPSSRAALQCVSPELPAEQTTAAVAGMDLC
ncbi:hypothetical protein B0T17DRAFT_508857 [Bombardia bombarda]|uniref:Uncharacterized protein n=1 Tax=Bombardia bombarda TaxID=252184 RepID=A0AA39WTX5_9PEZI|nr:hypothetical protein B0T17DRAFT_508857 [Bombardia bombarda]